MKRADEPGPMTEQRRAYADLLDVLVRAGIILLFATFAPYALGILRPTVPLAEVPALWSLPLPAYLERVGSRPGLWWVTMLRHADYLPLAGIAFLTGIPLACCARIVPIFARTRNVPFLLIALAQMAVLALSASGVLGG